MTTRQNRDLTIDKDSELPPYEQIREQITLQIVRGQLEPNTQLPTVYSLNRDLGLSTKTISLAYRELIRDGLIYTDNTGTYVAARVQDAALRTAAGQYAAQAHERGLSHGQATILLAQEWPREAEEDD